MDLTRLYNLTTPELREEAERLGVADTYAMSRGQLIQAIRTKSAPRQQEGLLGKVFGFAKWAIQAAGETSSGRAAPDAASASASAPAPASASASAPAPAPAPAPASASGPAPAHGAGDATDTGPPSRPPAGVFTSGAGAFEEPFPTLTMARILAEQGHFKRSLAIYARLLSDDPGDGELAAEANAVRAQARARRAHAPQ